MGVSGIWLASRWSSLNFCSATASEASSFAMSSTSSLPTVVTLRARASRTFFGKGKESTNGEPLAASG